MIQGRDLGDENDARAEGWTTQRLAPGALRGATFTTPDGREWRLCGCELTAEGWVWRCPEHAPEA